MEAERGRDFVRRRETVPQEEDRGFVSRPVGRGAGVDRLHAQGVGKGLGGLPVGACGEESERFRDAHRGEDEIAGRAGERDFAVEERGEGRVVERGKVEAPPRCVERGADGIRGGVRCRGRRLRELRGLRVRFFRGRAPRGEERREGEKGKKEGEAFHWRVEGSGIRSGNENAPPVRCV